MLIADTPVSRTDLLFVEIIRKHSRSNIAKARVAPLAVVKNLDVLHGNKGTLPLFATSQEWGFFYSLNVPS